MWLDSLVNIVINIRVPIKGGKFLHLLLNSHVLKDSTQQNLLSYISVSL